MSQSPSTEQLLETITRERSVINELVALSAQVVTLADELVAIQDAKVGLVLAGPAAISRAMRRRHLRQIA